MEPSDLLRGKKEKEMSNYLMFCCNRSITFSDWPRLIHAKILLTAKKAIFTMKMFGLMPRYFPFPQPMSATSEPTGIWLMKSMTRGQGLCLVLLKCDAIVSYTFKHHHQGNHRYQTPAPVHCCPLVDQYEYMLYSQVYAAPCIHINVVMTGRVVPEICSQTNTQIHRCAHHNTHTPV